MMTTPQMHILLCDSGCPAQLVCDVKSVCSRWNPYHSMKITSLLNSEFAGYLSILAAVKVVSGILEGIYSLTNKL